MRRLTSSCPSPMATSIGRSLVSQTLRKSTRTYAKTIVPQRIETVDVESRGLFQPHSGASRYTRAFHPRKRRIGFSAAGHGSAQGRRGRLAVVRTMTEKGVPDGTKPRLTCTPG